MNIVIEKYLEIYVTRNGKKPFIEWLENLKNKLVRYKIKERLDRVSLGNLGDFKVIKNGHGVCELRFDFSPGYRIYFGQKNKRIIILLSGGSKSTQVQDIKKAICYWADYLENEETV